MLSLPASYASWYPRTVLDSADACISYAKYFGQSLEMSDDMVATRVSYWVEEYLQTSREDGG